MNTFWDIWKGDQVIGRLKLIRFEQPWFYCELLEDIHFEAYRELFEKQTAAFRNNDSKGIDDLTAAIQALDLKLQRVSDGKLFHKFRLFASPDDIWFRLNES